MELEEIKEGDFILFQVNSLPEIHRRKVYYSDAELQQIGLVEYKKTIGYYVKHYNAQDILIIDTDPKNNNDIATAYKAIEFDLLVVRKANVFKRLHNENLVTK